MFYDSSRLLVIAGPCSLESDNTCDQVARSLQELGKRMPELQIVFKGSFDKANRTSLEGARGLGIEAGLAMLERIRKQFDLPVLTDVHLPDQVSAVAAACDIIQVPAFLCRQTDLLMACAASGRPVNVKKGQFLSPNEMEHVTGKLSGSGATEVWQNHQFLDRELIEAAHGDGCRVFAWTTDDPERMKELQYMGVDGVCTNKPDVAVKCLR